MSASDEDIEISDLSVNADGTKIVITLVSLTGQRITLDDYYFTLDDYVRQLARARAQMKPGAAPH